MKTERVKGFNDFTEEEAQKRAEIRKILVETFEKYGFQPAETPIIEYEEFVRGENEKDEAVSDIFKLKDKGKRNLALRYEFTFQLKRLMQNKKLPYKRYQIGEVFRDEPVSSNRFRQFTQCDVDVIGSTVKDEAEVLSIAFEIMKNLGIKNPMRFNNRKLMNEILEEQKIKNREGVMREIDKLEKIGEDSVRKNLKKYNAEKIVDIIKKPSSFFKKYESYAEIEELMKFCSLYDINVVFDPSLIRGLSYYSGSVFETNGIAGGSYVFNGIQSTGISFGLERISSLTKLENKKERFLIVSLNQDKESINLSQKLRAKNLSCTVYYGKPSKALEYANSYSISNVIFVGEKEVNSKRFKVKNMKTGKESSLKI
ncbi:MAG TPA: ATP phosphoribosyltransferase regulatory subunit [Candidatus Nanoarchaeia archaeon]|nr:ATP phosphoribosyltransferase regulatory subunit [Candidatus Nanoarchaeia archaeon]